MSSSSVASCNSEPSLSLGGREMLSPDTCPRCKVSFDFLKRVNISKVPLILDCKHAVCEDCIRRMCLANSLVCPICKEKFTVLRNQIDNLTDIFQPHYTVIGQLVWAKNSPNRREISFVSTGQTLGNRNAGLDSNSGENFDLESDNEYEKTVLIFDKCKDHKDEYLNIQCNECNDKFCCYCFLENHAGHKATYLYKLSETEKEELERFKTDLEIILAQVLASKRKVKDLTTFDSTSVETEVKNYFTELHAKLHVAERNIRKKLLNMDTEEADLDVVNDTLKTVYARVNHIMNHFKLLNTKQLNVRALYEEMLDLRDVPCCLTSTQGALRPIEFVTDSALDNIEDSIKLKSLPPICYTLDPIEDWSEAQERYEMELMRQQTELRLQDELKSESIAASKTYRSENEAKRLNEGKIRVQLTHINSLNSFYVQRYNNLDSLKDLNAMISKRTSRKPGIEFKVGGVYGVNYETKNCNQWRRGKVVDIVNHRYKVFFIDYGNTQYVTKDKLKELDIRSVKRQNFAQECKLTNPDNINFDPNAHLRLPQITVDKELYLRYVNKYCERGEPQEVDLLVAASNGGFISVRDLLTKTSIPAPKPKNFAFLPELKLFKNSKEFAIGQEEQVIVTYIKDPFYICVQMAENCKILEKMKNDMETFYKNQPPIARIPVEGTDVVVKYEDETQGNYHRAKIVSVSIPEKLVGVFFVDWGLQPTVSWNDLRELVENFIKVECQGIIVKLADVEKFDSLGHWPRDATNFLREQVSLDEQCRMLVKKEQPLEVALFQPRPSGDICLNSLLVEHKHAISTGVISQTVCWPNVMRDEVEGDEDDLTFQLIKKSQDILIDDEDDGLRSVIKQQVRIMNFKSPDLIYFKFNKLQKEDDDLHQQLQIHYASGRSNDVKQTKNSWKQGEKCVIFDSVQNNYFRAVIVAKSSPVNYLVYMFDYARELKVHKNYIFGYDHYFDFFRCHVYKCRLANIKPAGDAGTWSQLSIEMLQKIFAKYKTIYIRKVEENREEKIMGVMMWYCLTIQAKALEPSKLKFISINQTLIENGVAFGTSLSSSDPVREEEYEFEDKSGDESIKSATDKDEDHKEGTREGKQDWYEMVCKDEESVSNYDEEEHLTVRSGWPKPFPIQKKEFDAVLICVEDSGCLFIRDSELQSLYLDVEEKLTSKLNSMDAATKTDWAPNDMCTIFYEGSWYRGTVLKIISKDQVSVEMIDFGSEHEISMNDISKYIMLPEFPPLVYKIQLYDVTPKYGAWTPGDVEDLLQIVSDKIKVVIKGDLNMEIPYAEVYLDTGLSLNDLIVRKCPHLIRYENSVVLGDVNTYDEKDDWEEENTKANYTYDQLPKPVNGKYKMFIVHMLKWDNSFKVMMSSCDVTKNCDQVDGLTAEIDKHIEQQRSLETVKVNEPCACLHPRKKIWSRALVYDADSAQYGFVLVFFVDYGTVEMIRISDLKEMRKEWFSIPMQVRMAKINIELTQRSQAEKVFMHLNKLREKTVPVEIVKEEPLTVHLYDSEGKTLYYQHFVKQGIVRNSEL